MLRCTAQWFHTSVNNEQILNHSTVVAGPADHKHNIDSAANKHLTRTSRGHWWCGNMKKPACTAVCLQHFGSVSQSHARCVIQWLLLRVTSEVPTRQHYITLHLWDAIFMWIEGCTGKDTYRHHQLKGILVHPHRGLVLLHHGGDYSNTDNLNRNKKKKIRKERISYDHRHCERKKSWYVGLHFIHSWLLHNNCVLTAKMRAL